MIMMGYDKVMFNVRYKGLVGNPGCQSGLATSFQLVRQLRL